MAGMSGIYMVIYNIIVVAICNKYSYKFNAT